MKSYNYKKNLKTYRISIIIFLCLLLILGNKIINTTKVYGQYKEGKEAYAQQDYIAAQSLYSKLYSQTKFNYFSKEVRNILRTKEISFIKESIALLEDIKDQFQAEAEHNEIAAMLETHNIFNTRLAEVKQSSNEQNSANYNTLINNYDLPSLFLTNFEKVIQKFQEETNRNIESEDFAVGIDFNLYAQVLGKITDDLEAKETIVEEEVKKYYKAKLDWLIKEDNLESLLVETQQVINDYGSLMGTEWMVDKATEVVIRKMEDSIANENYTRYRNLGSRYFTYLSQLSPELSKRDEVKQLVSKQLESDYKKIKSHIASNKFEEATQIYDAIEEYIAIAGNTNIDMNQLNQDINTLRMKNDPIQMFSPLLLTEIAKGQSKWGRDAYVLATDAAQETLYWGEIDSQQEIKKLQIDISEHDIGDIYIHGELSSNNKPLIIVEEFNGYGGKFISGYRIEENGIVNVLNMDAESFEVKKQGKVLLGHSSDKLGINYYELIGDEYINVFSLGDIHIENTDNYYNAYPGSGNVFSYDEVEYISVSAMVYSGHDNSNSVRGSLGISYKDPYGNVMHHDPSNGNYTWTVPISTSNTQEIRQGLGANYVLGIHTVEFWWDGIKLAKERFTITE